jgi:hypothetical protein
MTTLPVTDIGTGDRRAPSDARSHARRLLPTILTPPVAGTATFGRRRIPKRPQAASRPPPVRAEPWAPWRVRADLRGLVRAWWGSRSLPSCRGCGTHSDPSHGLWTDVVDAISFIWIVLALPVAPQRHRRLTFRNASARDPTRPHHQHGVLPDRHPGTNVEAVIKTVAAVPGRHGANAAVPYRSRW